MKAPHRRDRLDRPRCPHCGSGYLARGERATQCRMCKQAFKNDELITETRKKPSAAGSGQIAGRITIRGFNWWANR